MEHLDWLFALEPAVKLGLERMEALLKRLGDPHRGLRSVHVAGSNGKGSVCAMLESVLRAAGLKTGRYISPHLKRFSERITVAGEEIGDRDLDRLAGEVRKVYEDETFFEVTTALAFLWFQEQKVDVAVVEVGMGGRLDATNVLTPLVSVITSISIEHTAFLGETIKAIAKEKAGIIKKGVPVVTMAEGEALKVIKAQAQQKDAPLFQAKPAKEGIAWGPCKDLELTLEGGFQLENLGVALETLQHLPFTIEERAIRDGLASVVWPGRFERKGNLIIDGAHNPAGIKALTRELKAIKKTRIIAVVGIMDDKPARQMLAILDEVVDYYLFAPPRQERAKRPEELAKLTGKPKATLPSVGKAIARAKKLAEGDDLVVVTGSLYTVAEA